MFRGRRSRPIVADSKWHRELGLRVHVIRFVSNANAETVPGRSAIVLGRTPEESRASELPCLWPVANTFAASLLESIAEPPPSLLARPLSCADRPSAPGAAAEPTVATVRPIRRPATTSV